MKLQAPLRYKIEGGWLWTKFGSSETWGRVFQDNDLKMLPINQRFGDNATGLYASMGLKGHNGTDWMARNFTCIYSPVDATVGAVTDLDAIDPNNVRLGKIELLWEGYLMIMFHCSDSFVKTGDKVLANQLIGLTGNTGGKYTTGSHLHTGLYQRDKSGAILDLNNGYDGAIDDLPFYEDPYVYKTDQLKQLYDYAKSNNVSYIGWGGSENFTNACKKLGITGVTRSQYVNYVIKRLFF